MMKIYLFLAIILVLLVPCQTTAQMSIWAGDAGEGSHEFAKEFTRLWKMPGISKGGTFVVKSAPSIRRLEGLLNRRGELAVLDAKTAYEQLSQYPQLGVISVLWPNVLHIISKIEPRSGLTIKTHKNLRLHRNSSYFAALWRETLNRKGITDGQLTWFGRSPNPESLAENQDAMILTAPYPVHELEVLFQNNPDYKLISLGKNLRDQLQKEHTWLVSHELPSGIYYKKKRSLKTVASHPVLISRNDLSSSLAREVLKLLFEQSSSVNVHVLFQNLTIKNNLPFRKKFNFHPESKKYFRF